MESLLGVFSLSSGDYHTFTFHSPPYVQTHQPYGPSQFPKYTTRECPVERNACMELILSRLIFSCFTCCEKVEDALRSLTGLANATVTRSGPKGLAYYPVDLAASLWYASSSLQKSLDVQTFNWDVTFNGLAGPQPLLKVKSCFLILRERALLPPCVYAVACGLVCGDGRSRQVLGCIVGDS